VSDYFRAARDLGTMQDRINPAVHDALDKAAQRVVATALPDIAPGAPIEKARFYGLRYRGPYRASGDRVSVQFRPTFVARWKEGGAKPHAIDPSASGSRKNLSFQKRKFKSAFTASRKAAEAKTQKSRDRWTAKGALALEQASAAQQGAVALGVLAIGRGKGKMAVTVAPGAKPDSNFTRRVHHPGIQASKPIARAINRVQPQIADDLRRRVDEAWATVHQR